MVPLQTPDSDGSTRPVTLKACIQAVLAEHPDWNPQALQDECQRRFNMRPSWSYCKNVKDEVRKASVRPQERRQGRQAPRPRPEPIALPEAREGLPEGAWLLESLLPLIRQAVRQVFQEGMGG